jgi:demethylmacrocin O-methyltransferase
MIDNFILKHFPEDKLRKFKRKHHKLLLSLVKAIPFYGNLDVLALIFNTDKNGKGYFKKGGGHSYTQHYSRHFRKFRFKKIKLLEIGVGGYKDPHQGGQSLRMWKKYFPFGNIFSLDIFDKSAIQENRIKIYMGSQTDPEILSRITDENGEFDLIIDDGSHINDHVITTFKLLFPKLKDGGIYVIEDLLTSYSDEMGGDNQNLNNPKTSMNFCKSLADCLNYSEFNISGYQPTYYDLHITEIHFYHNLVFIYKNKNIEKSGLYKSE